jgi:hypothetical protein
LQASADSLKKQRKLSSFQAGGRRAGEVDRSKSFLLLFFKKAALLCFL